MENKETADAFTTFREQNPFIFIKFPNREAMKAYYLQMSSFVNFDTPLPEDETENLKRLKRKLKQFAGALSLLNTHEWGEGITEIQTACGGYLTKSDVEFWKRMRVNETVSKYFEFIIRVAQNIYLLRQLQGLLNIHYQNVVMLIKESEGKKLIPE